MTTVLDKISRESIKDDVPAFEVGDTVKVHAKIYEGEKERVQIFPGIVLARDGGGGSETFTVRRVSHGVGVEKVFPVHSPHITKIEIIKSAYVRRAKLYFLRDRTSKQGRLKEKIKSGKR
ncbi:MAG: 50S ribosomal protein L19 [Kiritimatiellae bacterium]|nr:50S ribosomal protein L19 [Kiritimatiellia bacterium]